MSTVKNPVVLSIQNTWKDDKDNLIKRLLMNQLRANTALLKCKPDSVIASAREGIDCGLLPGKHFYLVPYKDIATCMYDWKGYLEFCYRSDKVVSIHVDVVRKGDEFKIDKGNSTIYHIVDILKEQSDEIIYAYARCWLKDSPVPIIETMSKAEIDKVKACAKSTRIWDAWYGEMAKKTVLRRLMKRIPQIPFPILTKIAQEDETHNELKNVTNSEEEYIEPENVSEAADEITQAFDELDSESSK